MKGVKPMPSKKSAIKELKKAKKRHQLNQNFKKALKTEEKKIVKLLESQDVEKLKTAINEFFSTEDKAIGNKLIHKNKASRKKASYLSKVQKLAGAKSKK